MASAAEDIGKIEHALKVGDMAELGRLGHYAKSPAGLIGATEYYVLCEQLEDSNDLAQAARIVPELRKSLQRFDEQMSGSA